MEQQADDTPATRAAKRRRQAACGGDVPARPSPERGRKRQSCKQRAASAAAAAPPPAAPTPRQQQRQPAPAPPQATAAAGSAAAPQQLEAELLRILSVRAPGATCCPSEAPRALAPAAWRPLMDAARAAARRLAAAGLVQITQKGQVVDHTQEFRGPIRVRLTAKGAAAASSAST